MNKGFSLLGTILIISLIALLGIVLLPGCIAHSVNKPVVKKITESEKAAKVANSIMFTENAEIDNIKKRLELTSNPGLVGFVVLLNEAGQPIMYTSIEGKLTSSGKRLTAKKNLVRGDRGEFSGHFVMDAPSDEGTHGSSAPYIYFWTTSGQYIQWNGSYLYSDKPLRLNVKPLVISVVD